MNTGIFEILLLALLSAPLVDAAEESSHSANEQRAILVTGASTGIGRNIAETLAARGHFVYAGARKQEDLDRIGWPYSGRRIRIPAAAFRVLL